MGVAFVPENLQRYWLYITGRHPQHIFGGFSKINNQDLCLTFTRLDQNGLNFVSSNIISV